MYKLIEKTLIFALALALLVVLLGAYTRLKDAGLGCPDWPGCYGNLIVTSSAAEPDKAWIEMIHRYIAGSLGILILFITVLVYRSRSKIRLKILTTLLLALVIFQALLGMWTVTLRLYPIVVMGHLLGGFAILTVLWLMYISVIATPQLAAHKQRTKLISLAALTTVCICMQIALGGWTSANYAALVCADFPQCQGHFWPPMDWVKAFDFTAVGIFDSPGVPLQNTARVTIQMAHRLGALISLIFVLFLAYALWRNRNKLARQCATVLLALISIQIALGITNVLAALPLMISLLHNFVAALLLLSVIFILFKAYAIPNTHA